MRAIMKNAFLMTITILSFKNGLGQKISKEKLFKKIQVESQSVIKDSINTTNQVRTLVECGGFCLIDQKCNAFFWNHSICISMTGKNIEGDLTPNGVRAYIDNSISPVNGSWSEWSEWTVCTLPCNSGIQRRAHTCNNPSFGGFRSCPENATDFTSQFCNTQVCSDCATFRNETGVITSPNFPNNYPDNCGYCVFIQSPNGKRINLTFTSFEIEFYQASDCDISTTCSYDCTDYMYLYDGPFYASPTLSSYICGLHMPNPASYVTTGNLMLVRFISNHAVTYKGFSANISFV